MSALATGMIRMDHTHVMGLFHRYKPDTSPRVKQALANTIATALEIHAQLEEEVFYPALRESGIDTDVVSKNVPEHNEMRRLIGVLHATDPASDGYDETFMELMRNVIHHVADEETILLPDAERRMSSQHLRDIGMKMTRRRLQITAPHTREMMGNMVHRRSTGQMLATGGVLLAGAYMASRMLSRGGNGRRWM